MKALGAVLVASFALAAFALAAAPGARFKPGQPFPDLALPSLDGGRPLSVASYRGKKLLLHIFASW